MNRTLKARLQKWLLTFNDPRWAFLQAALFYILISLLIETPFRLSNAPHFQYLADAFLHGQLNLRVVPPTDHDLVFFQGNTYLYWPPFPAIVMMPFVALVGLHFSDVFLVMMIGAFNVSLMALLLRAVNQRGIIALSAVKRAWLVIFFMAGTVHTTLALTGNVWSASQVISIAGLLVAYCAAVGLKGWKAYLFAGIGMAAAMSTRYTLILAGIWPAWYLINETRKAEPARLLRYMLIGSLPILIAGGLLGWYNAARFGSPFDYGYAYHNMSVIFEENYARYGAFNLHYIPDNVYYQYIYYPFPVREDFRMGGSLFLLSPVFFAALYSLWQDRKTLSTWVLVITISLVNLPILLLMGTGWQQFGPRYTLDFTLPLLLLTAQGCRKLPTWALAALTLISAAHYIVGSIIFLP